MRRAVLLLLLAILTTATSGCTRLRVAGEVGAERRLDRALVSLEAERYREATEELAQLFREHPDEPIGRRALRVLIASEIDPRNPTRALHEGAQLAAGYLRLPQTPEWSEPVAETFYLLALELGGAEEDPAEDAARERTPALPELPGTPVTERIRGLEEEAQRLARKAKRAERLEQRISELEQQIAACEQELERIRQTLTPG